MSVGNYLSTQADIEEYIHEHGRTRPGQLPPWKTALATFSAFICM